MRSPALATVGVVDPLEAVDVDQRRARTRAVAALLGEQDPQPLVELRRAGQAGERVERTGAAAALLDQRAARPRPGSRRTPRPGARPRRRSRRRRRSGISRRSASIRTPAGPPGRAGSAPRAAGPSRSRASSLGPLALVGLGSRPAPVESRPAPRRSSAISGGASLTIQATGSSPTSGSGVRSISRRSHSLASCSRSSCERAIWAPCKPVHASAR